MRNCNFFVLNFVRKLNIVLNVKIFKKCEIFSNSACNSKMGAYKIFQKIMYSTFIKY